MKFKFRSSITIFNIFCLWYICFLGYSVNDDQDDKEIKVVIPKRNIDRNLIESEAEQQWQKRATLDWVCIASRGYPIWKATGKSYGEKWYYRDTYYDLPCRECIIPQKAIYVFNSSAHGMFNFFSFKVNFTTKSLPKNLFRLSDRTVYFHSFQEDFEADNFFHFTKQFYFPLYNLMKETKTLHIRKDNIALFHKPWSVCPGFASPRKVSKYDIFFDMLGIEASTLSLFEEKPEPSRICYKKAIFSRGSYLDHALEAITYAQDYFGIDRHRCTKGIVLIINRSDYRRILNAESLKTIAINMGFDARIVALEKLSFKEQAQLIYCTEILVGVTGAGLQWAFFMRNHSGIVEIAWPQREWPFFFTGEPHYNSKQLGIRPLNFVQLSNVSCKTNPDAINIYLKANYHVDKKINKKDAKSIVEDPRNYRFKNHGVSSLGKLLDVIVDTEAFGEALMKARPKYSTNNKT